MINFSNLKTYVLSFIIGAIVMTGMRTVEWVFHKPPVKIIICYISSTTDMQMCETLEKYKQHV